MLNYFMSMLMLAFAVASVIAGIFTAYFGSGKSRAVGGIIVIIGLIVAVLFFWFAGVLPFMGTSPISWAGEGVVLQGVVAVIGAIVGAGVAAGMFLLSIMKA
jgi:hypothetical protein